jgi:hypothetical protein
MDLRDGDTGGRDGFVPLLGEFSGAEDRLCWPVEQLVLHIISVYFANIFFILVGSKNLGETSVPNVSRDAPLSVNDLSALRILLTGTKVDRLPWSQHLKA